VPRASAHSRLRPIEDMTSKVSAWLPIARRSDRA
jgi:hypothetical protein